MKLYAKYSSPHQVVQDDSAVVKALCSDSLRKTYYDPDLKNVIHNGYSIFMFFLFTLMVPLITVTLIAAIARSWHKEVHVKLTQAANHANTTGLVISGFFITGFIICLDLSSVFYSYTKITEVDESLQDSKVHRSAKYFKEHEFNFLITIFLTIYDSAIFLVSLSTLMYVCIIELKSCGAGKCYEHSLRFFKCFFNTFFFLIFGTRNQQHSWYGSPRPAGNNTSLDSNGCVDFDKERIANNRLMWVLMFSTIAPTFSVAGHLSFILMSWVTNPSQATAMFIQYIAILIFLFIMIRQCYLIHWKFKKDVHCLCLLLWPLYDVLRTLCCVDVCYRKYKRIRDSSHCLAAELQPITGYSFKSNPAGSKLELSRASEIKRASSTSFNSKAFCIAFVWSWAIVILIAFALKAFLELPVATLSLPSYLLNVLQITLVVLPLLITYKILSTSESEVLKFMKNVRMSYMRGATRKPLISKSKKWSEYDDVEAIGDLAGEVIHKLVNQK